jgi:hypothetical protein
MLQRHRFLLAMLAQLTLSESHVLGFLPSRLFLVSLSNAEMGPEEPEQTLGAMRQGLPARHTTPGKSPRQTTARPIL